MCWTHHLFPSSDGNIGYPPWIREPFLYVKFFDMPGGKLKIMVTPLITSDKTMTENDAWIV
jgi:hypothetical protein